MDLEEFLSEKKWLPSLSEKVELIITINTVINPTEDLEKVLNAARNIYPSITDFPVKITGDEANAVLDSIKQKVEQQQIMDAARRHILENLTFEAGTTVVYINKQVLLHGRLNFSDTAPLGPIIVHVYSDRIGQIINHYFPKAEWKYPKKRKKKHVKREKTVKRGEIIEEIDIEDIDFQNSDFEDNNGFSN
ncbi:MAG: RNA-binding domain-containing protein [Candidatus Hodarchaeales archaeon]